MGSFACLKIVGGTCGLSSAAVPGPPEVAVGLPQQAPVAAPEGVVRLQRVQERRHTLLTRPIVHHHQLQLEGRIVLRRGGENAL